MNTTTCILRNIKNTYFNFLLQKIITEETQFETGHGFL